MSGLLGCGQRGRLRQMDASAREIGNDHSIMETCAKILHAEDDENDVFFLRRAVQKAGLACQLFHVPDGQEAVDYLSGKPPYADRTRYPWPDLVLLDLKMPRMNGFDVLGWLREHSALGTVPIIILSSSSQQEDVNRALALGAADYRTKPHTSEGLVELIRSLHEHWIKAEPASDAGEIKPQI